MQIEKKKLCKLNPKKKKKKKTGWLATYVQYNNIILCNGITWGQKVLPSRLVH